MLFGISQLMKLMENIFESDAEMDGLCLPSVNAVITHRMPMSIYESG